MQTRKQKVGNIIFFGSNILLWLLLFSMQCLGNVGDYKLHNLFADLLMKGEFQISYPGYHLIVGGLHLISGLSTVVTAIPVLVLSQTSAIILTGILLKKYLMPDASQTACNIAALTVNVMLPIFYWGMAPAYSSCNTYVSPTQIAVKPFVVLSILFVLRMECQENTERERKKCQLGLLIALFFSCVVKPVFAMAFIPAMGIYYGLQTICSVKSIKQFVIKYWKLIWPFFVCGLFLIIQYWYGTTIEYGEELFSGVGGDSSISIGWLHSWSKAVDNVWLSLIYAYVFPIVYFVFWRKKEQFNNYWRIVLAYGVVSFFYMSCLYQTGPYEAGVNFRNAWIFTFYLVQAGCVSGFFKKWMEAKQENRQWRMKYIIPGICLLVQCMFGVALVIYKILSAGTVLLS